MSEHEQKPAEVTPEELEKQNGEPLPDREAMSLVWIEPDVLPGEGTDTTGDPPVKDLPSKELPPPNW
jgi:hypothetical protein